MNDKILDAIRKLDIQNDNHWTADGQPRLDTVKMISGLQNLSRENINEVANGFNRENAATWQPANQPAGPAVQNAASVAPAAPVAAPVAAQESNKTDVIVITDKDPSLVDLVKAKLAEQAKVVELAQAEKIRADKAYAEALRKHDSLLVQLENLEPKTPQDNAKIIRSYLDSQQAILNARAEQAIEARKAGAVNFYKSPLDASMSRKVGYGNLRPGSK